MQQVVISRITDPTLDRNSIVCRVTQVSTESESGDKEGRESVGAKTYLGGTCNSAGCYPVSLPC